MRLQNSVNRGQQIFDTSQDKVVAGVLNHNSSAEFAVIDPTKNNNHQDRAREDPRFEDDSMSDNLSRANDMNYSQHQEESAKLRLRDDSPVMKGHIAPHQPSYMRQMQKIKGSEKHCGKENQQVNEKVERPVQLIVAGSESQQVQRLEARCRMLEGYCKELIKTNKVLDMENRLCIAQLMNIFAKDKGGTAQLNNFISALQMMKQHK